jgi:hypothetical protein
LVCREKMLLISLKSCFVDVSGETFKYQCCQKYVCLYFICSDHSVKMLTQCFLYEKLYCPPQAGRPCRPIFPQNII